MRQYTLLSGKGVWGGVHHCPPQAAFPTLYSYLRLAFPFTHLYKKHFSSFRNIFPVPSFPFGPWHPATWGKCRVRDSVCSKMYSFLLSSFSLFLTSLPQLSSGKFTCFQFELHDSQPRWQAKCRPVSSSLEFFHYSLGSHVLPLCSLPIPCA